MALLVHQPIKMAASTSKTPAARKVLIKSMASPAKLELVARLSNTLLQKCSNKSQRTAVSVYLNMASEDQLGALERICLTPSIFDNIANVAKFVRGLILLNGDVYGSVDLGEKRLGAMKLLLFRDSLLQYVSKDSVKSNRELLVAWTLWKDLPSEVYLDRERISQYFKRVGMDPNAVITHLKPHPENDNMFTIPAIDTQQKNVNAMLAAAEVVLPSNATCPEAIRELDETQVHAVLNAVTLPVSFLHGSAGTGKTKTIGAIIKSVLAQEDDETTVVCAAFTHKAVKCIEARILASDIPMEDVVTCTIDSLIGKLDSEAMLAATDATTNATSATPMHFMAPSAPKKPGIKKQIFLILDEASMISLKLLSRLAVSLKSNQMIYQVCFVGDIGQLRPIDRGEMFRHLVISGTRKESNTNNTNNSIMLEICYRTSHQDLYDACCAVRNGSFPTKSSDHYDFYACSTEDDITRMLVKCIKAHGTRAQYLAWRNEDVVMISNMVQKWLLAAQNRAEREEGIASLDVSEVYNQRHYLPRGGHADVKYHVGDRVVFSGNKYKEVSRATLGTVTRIIKKGNDNVGIAVHWDGHVLEMEHRYDVCAPTVPTGAAYTGDDDDNSDESENNMAFMLAYCMTVHKSQGSEFDHVIIPCYAMSMQRSFEDRRWLYTAMSRGKEHISVIGIPEDIAALSSKHVPPVALLSVQCSP